MFRAMARERVLKKIIKKAEYLLENNDINGAPYSITNFVLLHYYVKAMKLAKGILALCKNGLDSDAQILFRSLFEIGCYCEYINIDSKDARRAENCIALSFIEDKKTEDYIEKFGSLDVNRMPISATEKEALKGRIKSKEEARDANYKFILDRLRNRDPKYKDLSDSNVIEKEKLTLGRALKEINEIFNKETNEHNAFWRYYIFGYRTSAESVHATDFNRNIKREDGKLEYYLDGNDSTVQMILGASCTFLYRIMDIASPVLQFKQEHVIKKIFNDLKRLQEKDG